MAVDRPRIGAGESRLSADLVAQKGFATSFRGFDQAEVRTFLEQVADELRRLREHSAALERALHAAEEQAAHPRLDENTLMTALGEETASILRSAKAAAADIKAKAEDNAARVLREAHARAEVVRGEADEVLGKRMEEADRTVAGVREAAESAAERTRSDASEKARQLLDQSKHEAKIVMDAAHATRDQLLGDLSRKRKVAMVQIEQLRAGRDRLLDAYRIVRRTLEEVTTELQRADAEARAAAEAAGRRAVRVDASVDEALRAELAAHGAGPLASDTAAGLEAGPAEVEAGDTGAPAPSSAPFVATPPGPAEQGDADEEATEAQVASDAAAAATAAPSSPHADPSALSAGPPASPFAPVAGPATVPPAARSDPVPGTGSIPGAGVGPNGEVLAAGLSIVEAPSSLESVRVISAETTGEPSSPATTEARGPDADVEPAEAPATERAAEAPGDPDTVAPVEPAVPPADAAGPPGGDGSVAGSTVAGDGMPDALAPDAASAVQADTGTVSNADETLLQRRDEATAPIEADLARRLKRALQDEQNDLLDRLRNVRGAPSAAEILPARDVHATRFRDAGRPLLERAAFAGAELALSMNGSAASKPPHPQIDIEDLAGRLAEAIIDPLRRRLEQAIHGDDDPVVLAESLGAAYREWKTQRIEQTAADQVAGAFSRGQFGAIAEGTPLRWIVDDVDGPCPDCDDNALAGSLLKGEQWPTGQQYPPAHVGCRCLLVPAPNPR